MKHSSRNLIVGTKLLLENGNDDSKGNQGKVLGTQTFKKLIKDKCRLSLIQTEVTGLPLGVFAVLCLTYSWSTNS